MMTPKEAIDKLDFPGEQLALHKALKGLLGDVGALREEVATLKAEIQTERHYRQTGTLPPKTPVGRARTPSDDMRGIR